MTRARDSPTDSLARVGQPTDSLARVGQPTDSLARVGQPTDSLVGPRYGYGHVYG
jgi:hypothetical protein